MANRMWVRFNDYDRTADSVQPQIWDFSFFPRVDRQPMPRPPAAETYLIRKGAQPFRAKLPADAGPGGLCLYRGGRITGKLQPDGNSQSSSHGRRKRLRPANRDWKVPVLEDPSARAVARPAKLGCTARTRVSGSYGAGKVCVQGTGDFHTEEQPFIRWPPSTNSAFVAGLAAGGNLGRLERSPLWTNPPRCAVLGFIWGRQRSSAMISIRDHVLAN
jgi:hypothetical protein